MFTWTLSLCKIRMTLEFIFDTLFMTGMISSTYFHVAILPVHISPYF